MSVRISIETHIPGTSNWRVKPVLELPDTVSGSYPALDGKGVVGVTFLLEQRPAWVTLDVKDYPEMWGTMLT